MIYTINYLEQEEIINIKIKGKLNYNIIERYSKEAIKLAREYKSSKFLFDHTETTLEEGLYKIHTAGEELQQFGFKNTDKIAILISNSSNYSKLFGTTNQNVWWCTFKYFNENDTQEAYDWLLNFDINK